MLRPVLALSWLLLGGLVSAHPGGLDKTGATPTRRPGSTTATPLRGLGHRRPPSHPRGPRPTLSPAVSLALLMATRSRSSMRPRSRSRSGFTPSTRPRPRTRGGACGRTRRRSRRGSTARTMPRQGSRLGHERTTRRCPTPVEGGADGLSQLLHLGDPSRRGSDGPARPGSRRVPRYRAIPQG